LQLFAQPEIPEWFSIICGIVLKVKIVAEQKQT